MDESVGVPEPESWEAGVDEGGLGGDRAARVDVRRELGEAGGGVARRGAGEKLVSKETSPPAVA